MKTFLYQSQRGDGRRSKDDFCVNNVDYIDGTVTPMLCPDPGAFD